MTHSHEAASLLVVLTFSAPQYRGQLSISQFPFTTYNSLQIIECRKYAKWIKMTSVLSPTSQKICFFHNHSRMSFWVDEASLLIRLSSFNCIGVLTIWICNEHLYNIAYGRYLCEIQKGYMPVSILIIEFPQFPPHQLNISRATMPHWHYEDSVTKPKIATRRQYLFISFLF